MNTHLFFSIAQREERSTGEQARAIALDLWLQKYGLKPRLKIPAKNAASAVHQVTRWRKFSKRL